MRLAWVVPFFFPLIATAAPPSATKVTQTGTKVTASAVPAITLGGLSEYRFPNGLRLVLLPDDSRPIVTINMTYLVGSRHEGYGESGMAHLLEHMLFRGTKRFPDLDKLYEERGGFSNGSTNFDRTNYFVSLPAKGDNLKLAIDIAFDQMTSTLLRDADLKKEFSVVRNEFESTENSPEGILYERLLSTAYLWHNYGKAPIGSKSDIERVPIEALRAFYKRFYRPDNAVLILAGKLDPKEAVRLVAAHANAIARPKTPVPATYTVEPVQDGERSVVLERTGEVALVAALYHGVSGVDPRSAAPDMLVDILTAKPHGRLYKALVESNLASDVFGGAELLAEPGTVFFGAKVRKDQSVDKAREVLLATIDALAKQPITAEELSRAQTRWLKQSELALSDPENVGFFLSEYIALGDWRMVFVQRDRVKAATLDLVQTFVRDFLKASNRTVGLFRPTPNPDRAPLPEPANLQAALDTIRATEVTQNGEAFDSSVSNIEKRTERLALASGMKLALLEKRSRGGVVHGQITLRFGSEADLAKRQTLAQLLGPMLFRGTTTHSYQQLRDAFDKLKAEVTVGGDLLGDSDQPPPAPLANAITIQFKTTRQNLVPLLDLLAEILRHPSFPASELAPLTRQRLALLEEMKHEPMVIGRYELMRRIDPHPPTSFHYHPTFDEQIEQLKSASVDSLHKIYTDLIGASAGEVVLVGDFDSTDAKAALERHFADWKSPRPYQRPPRVLGKATPEKLTLTVHDKQMALAVAGFSFAMRDDDPDVAALDIAATVLGSGFTSRLVERLRTKEGISYGAFANIAYDGFDPFSTFVSMAMANNQSVRRAASVLHDEIVRWVELGLTATELKKAKQQYAESFKNELAHDETIVQLLAGCLYEGKTLAYFDALHKKAAALTLDELNATLRRRIDPSQLVEVIAGDVK